MDGRVKPGHDAEFVGPRASTAHFHIRDSIFKQRTHEIVPGLFAAPGRRLHFSLPAKEGAERRKAHPCQSRLFRRRARTLRSVRSPPGAPLRLFLAGALVGPAVQPRPRFLGRGQPGPVPVQRAPRRASIVMPGRSPGPPGCEVTSLARGAPHLAPPSKRLATTPSDEQGGMYLYSYRNKVNTT
jgi:hypothetical protein